MMLSRRRNRLAESNRIQCWSLKTPTVALGFFRQADNSVGIAPFSLKGIPFHAMELEAKKILEQYPEVYSVQLCWTEGLQKQSKTVFRVKK